MKVSSRIACCCMVASSMVVSGVALHAAQPLEKAAEPFPLNRVKLLPSVFKARQDMNKKHLMEVVKPDRLLAGLREQAGLPKKADRYPGWEGAGINGHSLGHYLSALSACYAVDRDPEVKKRIDYIVDEMAACQKKNGDGYVMSVPKHIYDKVRTGNFSVQGFSINDWWVPNYTLHKLFAGLRDAYRLAGSKKALEVERKLADWYETVVKNLDEANIQKLLDSEWGGLNETFVQLAEDTGDSRYLAIAEKYFNHKRIFDPLYEGRDQLDNLHANTQVPKIVGLAELYEQTGDAKYRRAVETFWDSVVNHRSFANGGHSDAEHFFNVSLFPQRLGPKNSETCNINNMIRLTGHVFSWEPKAAQMDFVERALLNQILTQIGRKPGEYGYFLSQAPVAMKVFSTPEGAWWCCVGTGMENPHHYAEQAYFHKGDTLWINLYIASRLNWKEQGVALRQTTKFPESDISKFTLKMKAPRTLNLKFRHPYWCEKPVVSVNGEPVEVASEPSSYFTLSREWKDGDTIKVKLPMTLHMQTLPHSNDKFVAFMYGPMTLVGIVPPEKGKPDAAKKRWDDHLLAPAATTESAAAVVTDDLPSAVDSIEQTGDLRFRTKNLLKPSDLTLMPFHQVYEEHYTVYFPVMTREEWSREEERIAEEARKRAELEARTTDRVEPGFQQSEVNHNYKGEFSDSGDFRDRKYRHAGGSGWFSYDLASDPAAPGMTLAVVYFAGDNNRAFKILVDDKELVSERLATNVHDDFYEKEYKIPAEMTRGKKKITVRFQGLGEHASLVGGVFGVTLRR